MVQWLSFRPWSLIKIKKNSNIVKKLKNPQPSSTCSFRRDTEGGQKLHPGLLKSWLWPFSPFAMTVSINAIPGGPTANTCYPVLKTRTIHQYFLEIKMRMARKVFCTAYNEKISIFRGWEKQMGTRASLLSLFWESSREREQKSN